MFKHIYKLFLHHELIKTLVARDLKVRYKGSILGYVWTWLDPLLTMFVFILVFDILLQLKVEKFPIYLLTGLVPWVFFSNSVSTSLGSITGNAGLIKRVYYPREIFPLTLTLAHGINMILGFLVLAPVILIFGISITPKVFLLPIPVFFLFLFTFGLSLVFSCLNVFMRDMTYIVPFVTRLWFYMTPIFYVIEGRIPEKYLGIYMTLNPLALIISCIRAILMGHAVPPIKYMLSGIFLCVLVFFLGYTFFKKNEDMMIKRI